MPIITDRSDVLSIFDEAKENHWVIPAFGTENLTTSEAVLMGAKLHSEKLGKPDLPIMLAVTNRYPERSQTAFYTHTRDWHLGLELFLADLEALTEKSSPFGKLRVLIHLDHIQHDLDEVLWRGDLDRFSSIMFDASSLPIDENILATSDFVRQRNTEIVIEGACDYIGGEGNHLTTPGEAQRFLRETGVDWIVANLGTEHRAGSSALHYASDLARQISDQIGDRLVLHGTSSVAAAQLSTLSGDGIIKANLWTALERESSGILLGEMTAHAAKVSSPALATSLRELGVLGVSADTISAPALSHFTTAYRQRIVFEKMTKMVLEYLEIWYPQDGIA